MTNDKSHHQCVLLVPLLLAQGLVQECVSKYQELSTASSDEGGSSEDDLLSGSGDDADVPPRDSRHDVWKGAGGYWGSSWEVQLAPFHPLLILSDWNAVTRREREKAPESTKSIRPAADLFNVPLGHAVPPARNCGAVWSPMGFLWIWTRPGQSSMLNQDKAVGAAASNPSLLAGIDNKAQDLRDGVAAAGGSDGAGEAKGHCERKPSPFRRSLAVRTGESNGTLLTRRDNAPSTPARRLAKERALYAHEIEDAVKGPGQVLPSQEGHASGKMDRIDSTSEGTGGAGASSIGDLDLAEVFAHFTSQVAGLDLGLAQGVKIKCTAGKSFVDVCKHNSNVALQHGRPDVAQTWIVAAHTDVRAKDIGSWSLQPMGRRLLCTLVEHHAMHEDIQTVASLVAVFVSAFGSETLLGEKWRPPRAPAAGSHQHHEGQQRHELSRTRSARHAGAPASSTHMRASPHPHTAAESLQRSDSYPPVGGAGVPLRQAPAQVPSRSKAARAVDVHVRGRESSKRWGFSYEMQDKDGEYAEMDDRNLGAWSWGGREGERTSPRGRGSQTREQPAYGAEGKGRACNVDGVIRALLGEHPLHQMSCCRVSQAGPVSSIEWVSWAVTHYIDVLFSYKLLDMVAQFRDVFPDTAPGRGAETNLSRVCVQVRQDKQDKEGYAPSEIQEEGGSKVTQKAVLRCSLCRLPVRGIATTCSACGHGGHLHHQKWWFAKYSICPSGCGCQCHFE
jgi:hypothetical protein